MHVRAKMQACVNYASNRAYFDKSDCHCMLLYIGLYSSGHSLRQQSSAQFCTKTSCKSRQIGLMFNTMKVKIAEYPDGFHLAIWIIKFLFLVSHYSHSPMATVSTFTIVLLVEIPTRFTQVNVSETGSLWPQHKKVFRLCSYSQWLNKQNLHFAESTHSAVWWGIF